jgi:signal transduction histidine kinase
MDDRRTPWHDLATALGMLAGRIANEISDPIGIVTSRLEAMLLEAEDGALPAHLWRISGRCIAPARGGPARHEPPLARPTGSRRAPPHRPERRRRRDSGAAPGPLAADGIAITTTLDRALPPARADAAAIQQVLLNLVTNAREAMTGRGEILIETGRVVDRPGWLRLVVADTGPGIAPDALARIFDPLFTTKPRGSGLGLAVCRAIMEAHQGAIATSSRGSEGAPRSS